MLNDGASTRGGPAPGSPRCRIVVLAKAPVPGRVKTRLAAAIGHDAAAALAHRMLDHALRQALDAGLGPVRLCGDPDGRDPGFRAWSSDARVERTAQAAGDLGRRMARALLDAATDPMPDSSPAPDRVLLMGTDAPALDAGRLRAAAARLDASSVVFVPALDGGYALVGLRSGLLSGPAARESLAPKLFEGIAWSTPRVMETTRLQLSAASIDWAEEPPVRDIDTADDLAHGLPPGF